MKRLTQEEFHDLLIFEVKNSYPELERHSSQFDPSNEL